MDPRLKKLARELFGDAGVTDDDHEIAIRIARAAEIPFHFAYGRLIVDGEPKPWSKNKMIHDGPGITTYFLWQAATGVLSPAPASPTIINLGTGTTTYSSAWTGCETVITDAGLVYGAATSVVVSTANASYTHDLVTVTKAWGVLSGLASGPHDVKEMALRTDTSGTIYGFGRLQLATQQITTATNLSAEYKVQYVP